MEILVISIVALIASGLTLFSGFGLGTLLMPVMALYFPLPLAVAITAIVHLANNLFKFFLFGKHANWKVTLTFGIPAIIFSLIGSLLLVQLNIIGSTTILSQVIGTLIIIFALFELIPALKHLRLPSQYLLFGGALSGFFGGLSGHQGAFRSMFLIKSHMRTEQFIASNVVIAVMVDISRLSIYQSQLDIIGLLSTGYAISAATLSAFAGAYIGSKFIKKVTYSFLQSFVGLCLLLIGVGFIFGYIRVS